MITLDLNGDWTLHRPDTGGSWPARVPGCNFADLVRSGAIPDPFFGRNEFDLHWVDDCDWEYERSFVVVPGMLEEKRVELVCEGLDTLAEIFVNGRLAGAADNMFRSWRFNVKRLLRVGGNMIIVRFLNPTAYCLRKSKEWNHAIDDGAAFLGSLLRKQHSSFSWDWAPSLPPSGIHRAIRLEAGSVPRLVHARISQTHEDGKVLLRAVPEFEHGVGAVRWTLTLRGSVVAGSEGGEFVAEIDAPELWWPSGHGGQPLYELRAEPADPGIAFAPRCWRIGLRTVELATPDDNLGQGYFFKVNGRTIYAKGANWAPPHQWASEVDRARYASLLLSARDAHFNMIRVWGGGLYEQSDFYDLCDELGLLVWHDFLFSCSLYPGAPEFLENVTAEATEATRSLAHRPCLVLWCGNNELEHFIEHIKKSPERERAFLTIFYGILPGIVASHCPEVPYWPGSPHNPKGWDAGPSVEDGGDGHHYWTGWDKTGLPEGGTDKLFRFCSEFGLQSFPSIHLIRSFTSERGRNWFSSEIAAHEKSPGMLVHMLRDLGRLYPLPDSFEGQILASQFVQGRHLQAAIEHHRRNSPRCMGSLYWQLNDTWPAISWSTLEFGGRWKPAHYVVRRAFSPTIVSLVIRAREIRHLHGRMEVVHEAAEAHVIHDGSLPWRGRLLLSLRRWDGGMVASEECEVAREPVSAGLACELPLAGAVASHGADSLFVFASLLDLESQEISRRVELLVAPKDAALAPAPIRCVVHDQELTVSCDVFRHGVWIDFADQGARLSDNAFDLLPGETRTVTGQWPPGEPPRTSSLL
jgi:beta-mannosidase